MGSQKEVENSVTGFNGSDGRTTKAYSPGKFGNGADILFTEPTIGDQVKIDSVLVTSEGAVEAWVKLNGWGISGTSATDGLSHRFWNHSHPPNTEHINFIFINGQGMHFDVFDGANFRLTITSLSIPADTLVHLAVAWSEIQSLQKVFVDGVEKGSRTSVINLTDTHISNLAIGKREDSTTQNLKGIADNLKIWSFFQTDFSKRERQRFGMNDSVVLV